ncbi:hypothetical protein LBMAG52_29040 [Planctomycetia bacterium]|nr:hypothetical protein LBMAG52_29040 [Planctomycetia bacterium]
MTENEVAQALETLGLPVGFRKKGIVSEQQGSKSGPVARGVHSLRVAANFGKDGSVATPFRELDSGQAQKFTTEETRTKRRECAASAFSP